MGHKFMVVDSKFLVTGSFNWTTLASTYNNENLVIVDNKIFIDQYNAEFNKLWS